MNYYILKHLLKDTDRWVHSIFLLDIIYRGYFYEKYYVTGNIDFNSPELPELNIKTCKTEVISYDSDKGYLTCRRIYPENESCRGLYGLKPAKSRGENGFATGLNVHFINEDKDELGELIILNVDDVWCEYQMGWIFLDKPNIIYIDDL